MPKTRNPENLRGHFRILFVRYARRSVLAGLLAARVALASATTPSVEEFVRQLESSYRNVRTLRAQFTQTYVWGGRSRIESGTVYFARGGRMRWDYRQPQEKVFVSDGKTLCLYVPEEKQLTRSSVNASEDVRVPFRLLLSRLNLRKFFSKIEFGNQAMKAAAGNRILRALPRSGYEEEFLQVLIEVSPSFDILRLVIFYSDQSSMEFTFDRIEQNVAISPALFRLNPPPGTEVIDQP